MTENDFILADRIQKIKSINNKYDLESNSYISFSGGRDSTVLHHLIDEALPGNKIPRVYVNTGIEYKAIVSFVEREKERDDRIQIIIPGKNIKTVLKENGYPFKSKQHSLMVSVYQHSGIGKSINRYLGTIDSSTQFRCPEVLKYQFTENFYIKISDKCCAKLKKEPFRQWELELQVFQGKEISSV